MTDSEVRACLNRLIERYDVRVPPVDADTFLYGTVIAVGFALWMSGGSGDEDAEALRKYAKTVGMG